MPSTVPRSAGTSSWARVARRSMHHVTTSVLLENLRRLDPELADRLTDWMLTEDGVFSDGYAGELLHGWRQQLAAGEPLAPIGPAPHSGESS